MKTLYETSATVTGGRNGKITSENGALELEVRMPKELGGSEQGYTNPEQLLLQAMQLALIVHLI